MSSNTIKDVLNLLPQQQLSGRNDTVNKWV